MSRFKELVESHPLVLVDFKRRVVPTLQMLQPILKEVAQQMGDRVRILKIDIDKNAQGLAGQLGIQSVPHPDRLPVRGTGWRSSSASLARDLIKRLNRWHKNTAIEMSIIPTFKNFVPFWESIKIYML